MIYQTIISPRLTINPLSIDPVKNNAEMREIVGWLNNPLVVRFSEQRHITHSITTQLDYVYSFYGKNVYLGIYFEGKLIGTVSVHYDSPNEVADVGIMIGHHEHWGKGLGLEAWKAVCDALFEEGCRKIEAGCMSHNVSMMSICLRYGMMEEGRREDHFLFHTVPTDLVMWGKVK